jgi:hypothetical protein
MYASPGERHAQPFPMVPATAPMTALLPQDLVPEGEHRGMLASPAFWIGGAASVLCWTGIALALLRLV